MFPKSFFAVSYYPAYYFPPQGGQGQFLLLMGVGS